MKAVIVIIAAMFLQGCIYYSGDRAVKPDTLYDQVKRGWSQVRS